jgi:hypothetical protein
LISVHEETRISRTDLSTFPETEEILKLSDTQPGQALADAFVECSVDDLAFFVLK